MKLGKNNLFVFLLICLGVIAVIIIVNDRLNREMESLTDRPAIVPAAPSQVTQPPVQPKKRRPIVIDSDSDPLAPMVKKAPPPPQKYSVPKPEKPRKTYEAPLEVDILIQ